MMEGDDWKKTILQEYDTAFRTDFVAAAREAICQYPDIRGDLTALKQFGFRNPGFDCPSRRVEAVNEIKDFQIDRILGK